MLKCSNLLFFEKNWYFYVDLQEWNNIYKKKYNYK